MDDGFDKYTIAFLVVFGIVFVLILGAFVVAILRGIMQWGRNNAADPVTEPARVVTKRTQVSGGSGDTSASTGYYVTFEIQGGERKEMQLGGREYGMLAEGDQGRLSYQGTRYKGFDRTPQDR